MSESKPHQHIDASSRKPRIETQIHRRKKAGPVPPLQAEWDADSGIPPSGLRTPSDRMRKKA